MRQWLRNFAPDIAQTFSRFPFAIILSLLCTIVSVGLINELFPQSLDFDVMTRLALGLSVGAVFAVAGTFYGEAQTQKGVVYLILAYVLPLLAVGVLQISSTSWIVSPMLLPIGLLWLSLSAFTPAADAYGRDEAEDRFWLLNHRAITTAVIAAIAFGLIAIGIVAVERSLAVLFGLQTGELFYQYLLPFTGLFFAPVYWLSTLPKLTDYRPEEISEPDFLSRAVGFLGQFVLTPFLFLYALILLAYAAQIVLTFSLPEGMLGWMVLGFTLVGAANWLVLHPSFMHKRPLVNYFRKFWFWLTLVPIALYWLAVFVRVDIYGLTPDRIGLIAGGLWALLLSLAFLSKRFADIRLIPGLALALIAFWSVGPWNFVNLPQAHQAMRLDDALFNATPSTQSTGGPYEWTDETANTARGAFNFLYSSAGDKQRLAQVLGRHGMQVDPQRINGASLFQEMGLDDTASQTPAALIVDLRTPDSYIFDASETPFVLGKMALRFNYAVSVGPVDFTAGLKGFTVITLDEGEKLVEMQTWLDQQTGDQISQPVVEFEHGGTKYRLVISNIQLFPGTSQSPLKVQHIRGVLYGDQRPPED